MTGPAADRPVADRVGVRLPGHLRAAGAGDLLGRWVTETPAPHGFGPDPAPPTPPPGDPCRPSLTFDPTGVAGYDGCNHQGGSWAVGPDGLFVCSPIASTLALCAGQDLSRPLEATVRVGFDGAVLVGIGAAGQETLRLIRADPV